MLFKSNNSCSVLMLPQKHIAFISSKHTVYTSVKRMEKGEVEVITTNSGHRWLGTVCPEPYCHKLCVEQRLQHLQTLNGKIEKVCCFNYNYNYSGTYYKLRVSFYSSDCFVFRQTLQPRRFF